MTDSEHDPPMAAVNKAALDVVQAMRAGKYRGWSAEFIPDDNGLVWRVRVSSRKATKKEKDRRNE